MSGQRYVARSSETAARKFEGEMIVMSARDSMIFSLNEVATVIWESADGATPLDEIVATKICAQFDVERDVALADAAHLVEELARHGILVVSESPIGAPGLPPEATT